MIMLVKLLFLVLLFGMDWYTFRGIKLLIKRIKRPLASTIRFAYWGLSAFCIVAYITYEMAGQALPASVRYQLIGFVFVVYSSKLFVIFFLLADDIRRLIMRINKSRGKQNAIPAKSGAITRSRFLARAGLIAAAIPITSLGYGIISGAYDYRLKKVRLVLPNLPKAFEGLRIGQISDIHTGSLMNKTAVEGGIEILMNEKPDIIFFTGDLINSLARETQPFMSMLQKIKADLGVFSILGNHDYGGYVRWSSKERKSQNTADLDKVHEKLGWDLLKNESRLLEQNGERIAIIGVENWGKMIWMPRLADLGKAKIGSEETSVKLLLSHDPTHWDAHVIPSHPDIDVTFAGHTHGMQFGVEWGNIKWSPAQYFYPHWAGLYKQDHQYLYVNRGFGFIGYPGRVGIQPELTIFELTRS